MKAVRSPLPEFKPFWDNPESTPIIRTFYQLTFPSFFFKLKPII
jgi:hypothetical protein